MSASAAAAHRVVLLGPPASGKGTQGQRLAQRWGAPITSTGELLRREHNLGTELGLEADRLTSLGQLVPDEVVTHSVGAWLDGMAPGPAENFILDGTPRTLGQAAALDEMLSRRGLPLTDALFLDVTPVTVADRIRHRLMCERCGRAFRRGTDVADATDACPACGGVLERRKDDTPEALVQRMAEYEEKTVPLLPFYATRGLLRRVAGEGTVDEVSARVLAALKKKGAQEHGAGEVAGA